MVNAEQLRKNVEARLEQIEKEAMENCTSTYGVHWCEPQTAFEKPTQVQWLDKDKHIYYTGIAFGDSIVNAYDGSVIPRKQWNELTYLIYFDEWLDITTAIAEDAKVYDSSELRR